MSLSEKIFMLIISFLGIEDMRKVKRCKLVSYKLISIIYSPLNSFRRYSEKIGLDPYIELIIKSKVAYVMIPKSGSSSLKVHFYRMKKHTLINYIHFFRQSLFVKDLSLHTNNEVEKIVVFFRDPIERFLSAYIDKCLNKRHWQDDLDNMELFIDNIAKLKEESIDKHFRPQSWFIKSAKHTIPLDIISLKKMNNYFGINSKEQHKSKIPKPILEARIISKLERIYKEDIQIFKNIDR